MEYQPERRSFIAKSAAVIAAGASSLASRSTGAAPRLPQDQPRAIRKAVKFGMVDIDAPVREKFALLAELGFDGVEVDRPSDLSIDELLEAQENTGVVIHGVVDSAHWRFPLSHPDKAVRAKGRNALEQALRDAKTLGASTVLLVPAIVNKEVSYRQAWERSQAEIAPLLPLARELQVKVAIENVWNNFLLSPLEAARYVDSFQTNAIKWYFDIGNVVNYGWPEHWIQALGGRILKIDVKEYSRSKRDAEGLWKGFNVELMEGDCDWPAVMQALDEIAYRGWMTAEISGGGEERLRAIATKMDQIIAL